MLLAVVVLLLGSAPARAQFEGSQPAQVPQEDPESSRQREAIDAGDPPPRRPSSRAGSQKIYKFVLPDGRITYSDRPPEDDPDAQEVRLSPLQTYSPPPTPALDTASSRPKPDDAAGYEELEVTSPANDATLRDNGGSVSISIALKPGLHSGHSIDIVMDGKSIGSGNSTSVTLTNVDRGSHTVQAKVLDEAGKVVISSNSITFHLQRAAVRPAVTPRATP
ncbi:MAG: DUF4124 domain-containing protein [Gammaproteobacteria bacterium]|nr:DUF4124 domain-containing protein [Gammaproteobacteria bacterium]